VFGVFGGDLRSREERVSQLEIAIDSFNVFNHTNFKNDVGTLTSPFFGRANAANPPLVQVSLRYHF